jgi:hypothetical protein
MKRFLVLSPIAACAFTSWPTSAQQALVVKPLAEKRVRRLLSAPLFWRLERVFALAP